MVAPFAAFEWSSVHTSAGNPVYALEGRAETVSLTNLSNTNAFAYTIGTSIIFTEAINITAEGRFAGEKALSAMAQFLF